MDSIVKTFKSFNGGWLGQLDIDPDLSKLEFGEGYTIKPMYSSREDPLFCQESIYGKENILPWYKDTKLMEYIFRMYNLEDTLRKYLKWRTYDDEHSDERFDMVDKSSLTELIEVFDSVYNADFSEFFYNHRIPDLQDGLFCGITDEKYLKQCMMKLDTKVLRGCRVMSINTKDKLKNRKRFNFVYADDNYRKF